MSRWDAFDEDELAIIAAGAVLAAIMELKGDIESKSNGNGDDEAHTHSLQTLLIAGTLCTEIAERLGIDSAFTRSDSLARLRALIEDSQQ
jgi:hypothetical protein